VMRPPLKSASIFLEPRLENEVIFKLECVMCEEPWLDGVLIAANLIIP
jgi:hypothetical protein